MPIRVVVSPKTLAGGEVELTLRRDKSCGKIALDRAFDEIRATIDREMQPYLQ